MADEKTQDTQEQKVSTPEEIEKYMEQSLSGEDITVPEPTYKEENKKDEGKKDEKTEEGGEEGKKEDNKKTEPSGDAEGSESDSKGKPPEGGESKSEETTKRPETYNPIWDRIVKQKKEAGIDFEIPKEIIEGKTEDGTEVTPDMEYDMIADAMKKKEPSKKDEGEGGEGKDEGEGEDVEGKKATAEHEQNIKANEFLKKPSKEFIELMLKSQKDEEGERKYSDEEIEEYIDSKNKIDLDKEANAYKEQYARALRDQQIKHTKEQKQKQDKELNTFVENREKELSGLLDDMAQEDKIGGLPHGEAERKEFEPVFRKLMGFNKETKKTAIGEFFSGADIESNEVEQTKVGNRRLYEALFAYFQGKDGKTDKYLSKFKEDFKQNILDKTDTAPRKTEGKVTVEKPPDTEDFVM